MTGSTAVAPAKRKRGRPRGANPLREGFSVKCRREYLDYLGAMSRRYKMPLSSIVELGIGAFARSAGWPAPPDRCSDEKVGG